MKKWMKIAAVVLATLAAGIYFSASSFEGEMLAPIKAHLKDPDSAIFSGTVYTTPAICTSVNSKNSFGAYTGAERVFFEKEHRVVWFENSGVATIGSAKDFDSSLTAADKAVRASKSADHEEKSRLFREAWNRVCEQ